MEGDQDEVPSRLVSLERRLKYVTVTCVILGILVLAILIPPIGFILGVILLPVLALVVIVGPILVYIYGVQRALDRFFGSVHASASSENEQ